MKGNAELYDLIWSIKDQPNNMLEIPKSSDRIFGWEKQDIEKEIEHFNDNNIEYYIGDDFDESDDGKNWLISGFESDYAKGGSVRSSLYDAHLLHRLSNIGTSKAEEFLSKHNVDMDLLVKAISQKTINKFELRDIILGDAHKFKIKSFMEEFVIVNDLITAGAFDYNNIETDEIDETFTLDAGSGVYEITFNQLGEVVNESVDNWISGAYTDEYSDAIEYDRYPKHTSFEEYLAEHDYNETILSMLNSLSQEELTELLKKADYDNTYAEGGEIKSWSNKELADFLDIEESEVNESNRESLEEKAQYSIQDQEFADWERDNPGNSFAGGGEVKQYAYYVIQTDEEGNEIGRRTHPIILDSKEFDNLHWSERHMRGNDKYKKWVELTSSQLAEGEEVRIDNTYAEGGGIYKYNGGIEDYNDLSQEELYYWGRGGEDYDYDDLYELFPDNWSKANKFWGRLNKKQKDRFENYLSEGDAASEHLAESWLEFVNAESEEDFWENATNWDEYSKGGSVNSKWFSGDLEFLNW
jgi:hypothetical protein